MVYNMDLLVVHYVIIFFIILIVLITSLSAFIVGLGKDNWNDQL